MIDDDLEIDGAQAPMTSMLEANLAPVPVSEVSWGFVKGLYWTFLQEPRSRP